MGLAAAKIVGYRTPQQRSPAWTSRALVVECNDAALYGDETIDSALDVIQAGIACVDAAAEWVHDRA